ncbi:hypothetical protein ABVK25_011253 [Lepraria finkii]|uniref:Uncharacterized protein n=1 Tax=Lepraria finkii TaxID=1340010 RepID=A0ABR4AQB5_9LECA
MNYPEPKDSKKPALIRHCQDPARQPSLARDYLPGGQKYEDGPSNNPRQGAPIPQWLREWEQNWERITGVGNEERKSKL